MTSPTPAEQYLRNPYAYTHGRCRPCGILFAWRAGRGRRLKDGPACPDCGAALTRTSQAVGDRAQVREPVWSLVRTMELRAKRRISR